MNHAARAKLYQQIETQRDTKLIGLETQIAEDCVDLFVDLLDTIGPVRSISLLLHTNGGQTSAAWRLINLIRMFCDELEVIVPLKALSAGTLISLGADRIIMTKQAALGPIDPSLLHALSPTVPFGNPAARVAVSVEAVRGYLDAATRDLSIKDDASLAGILTDLSCKIHPLVLGEIFRSREQIRFLANKLIRKQVQDEEKVKTIIDFLCADSGSHDYTINRREADTLGLKVEKPSAELYPVLKQIHQSYVDEMKLLEPFSREVLLGTAQRAPYCLVRSLVERAEGKRYEFVSEGVMTRTTIMPIPVPGSPTPAVPQEAISDQRTFEGWRSKI